MGVKLPFLLVKYLHGRMGVTLCEASVRTVHAISKKGAHPSKIGLCEDQLKLASLKPRSIGTAGPEPGLKPWSLDTAGPDAAGKRHKHAYQGQL